MTAYPKKKFGQNFLIDKNITRKIAAAGELKKNDIVWEIGPGRGILTEELLKTGASVTAFEIDDDLIPQLEQKFSTAANFHLLHQDILTADWSKLFGEAENKITIVANIPYNITSPLLRKITQHREMFHRIVLMIQKEVAERIISLPGNKTYGVLSLKVQHYFTVKKIMKVPPHLFIPKPNVDSMVISLTPYQNSFKPDNEQLFWQIVESGFHSRRKTLKNNLLNILSKDELEQLRLLLEEQENNDKFSLSSRGEILDEKDYILLYNLIRSIRKN